MDIEIHRLTPDLVDDYVQFFDTTPHATNQAEHKCYCVWWCNANTKSDCLKCYCWRRFMGFVPTEEGDRGIKVKSIFCFAIAPEMKRKGIAKLLVERVCQDAGKDGFDFVEAYPNKEFMNETEDFMGPVSLYERNGFSVYHEAEQKLVMRKPLQDGPGPDGTLVGGK